MRRLPLPGRARQVSFGPEGELWALVTGASAGIGEAYVRHLADAGFDLVLVARDQARLEALATDVRAEHGSRVEVLPADLTDPEDCTTVERRLGNADRPVGLLVNNAGFVLRKPFVANSVQDEERMLDIHVRAVLRLTKAAVDAMVPRGEGAVINVASMAAYAPRGTYSAHKAWTVAFSEAVGSQVEASGVHVMALCPGLVDTELADRAGMRISAPRQAYVDVDRLVADSLVDLRRGRRVCTPTKRYTTAAHLLRHAPHWLTVPDKPLR